MATSTRIRVLSPSVDARSASIGVVGKLESLNVPCNGLQRSRLVFRWGVLPSLKGIWSELTHVLLLIYKHSVWQDVVQPIKLVFNNSTSFAKLR